jgi:hypothetical protein
MGGRALERVRSPREPWDSERFHEGRGAGKSTTPGGHRLVSGKEKLQRKNSYRKEGPGALRLVLWAVFWKLFLSERVGKRGDPA